MSMSNPTDRVEIITSVQRRRRWTASEKVRSRTAIKTAGGVVASYLTSDNQRTRKPNLALNAEIESSRRAANSARCARAFLSLCPNRDRVGFRQPRYLPDDGPDVGGGVRTELEANLNAAGAPERYQYWSDELERCFSNNAPEASHDRHQPQFPSDYRQSSE